eukprot:GHVL01028143.1.p1 GENE.GHVL01028143.1~~GHVL01028143.1.p1  ORF type:complete len:187 (+),score=44.28 GHVL01028143.1:235-795(+)
MNNDLHIINTKIQHLLVVSHNIQKKSQKRLTSMENHLIDYEKKKMKKLDKISNMKMRNNFKKMKIISKNCDVASQEIIEPHFSSPLEFLMDTYKNSFMDYWADNSLLRLNDYTRILFEIINIKKNPCTILELGCGGGFFSWLCALGGALAVVTCAKAERGDEKVETIVDKLDMIEERFPNDEVLLI